MAQSLNFGPEGIKIFEELGKKASSKASLALSTLIGEQVEVQTLGVHALPIEEVMKFIKIEEDRVATVIMEIEGDVTGDAALLFPQSSALNLANLMNKRGEGDKHTELDELDLSALKEAGNIVTGALLSSISNFLGVYMQASIPDIAIDMVSATVDYVAVSFAKKTKDAIAFGINFRMGSTTIVGHFFILLDTKSAQLLMEKINKEAGEVTSKESA